MDGKSMRYNHESYLPIGAFQPILGRMTLHGGGGGFISDAIESVSDFISPVTDVINDVFIQPASDVLAASDDYITQPITAPISQVTSALDDAVIQPITEPIGKVGVAIDDAVADVIPGGWGTLAQIAAAVATMGQSIPIQAAAAAAAGAGSDYAKNKDIKSAVEQGAIKGATRYGLGTLGEMISGPTDVLSADDAYMGKAMTDLSSLQPESAVTSLIPEPTVGASFGPDVYPDAPPPVSGEIQMTDSGEFINKNPDIQNADFIPKKIELTPDLRIREDILNQANLDAAYTPDSQYINQDAQGYDKVKFKDDPYRYLASRGIEGKDYAINKATGAIDYLSNRNPLDYPGDLYDAAKDYYNESSPGKLALTAAGAYGLSNLVGGGGGEQQSQTQAEADAAAKKAYTYGTAGPMSPNYLLKNRINAGNVYSDAAGYRPLNRYADGGEVQHYGIGGRISDAFTRVAQPFEKAILRPIGEAVPFIKDLAPYAGMALGAMTANPYVAGTVGGIASGFGKPGGFDFKRAFMGGFASYGMSNLMSGLEAAGTETALPPIDSASTVPDYLDAMKTANTPYTAEEVDRLIKPPTISTGTGAVPPSDIFRSKEQYNKMGEGIKNLLGKDTSDSATKALLSKAGMYKAGLPLIMGTTGMMGVDESNALKQEYDIATAKNQADTDKFNARTAAGKKRAQQAVSENPYMFAMGGAIDDEYGGDDMNTVNGNMQNGFMGYADGGPVTNAEDLEFMTQLENNRNEVDPMSDPRYAGLLKQNQDYLSKIYGNIYNQPTPQPVAPPPVTVTPSVEPTPLTGTLAPPPPPSPVTQPPPLDIETVRANAQKALEMSQNVMSNITDATTAVNTAQDLIGMPTTPPPIVTTPDPVAPTSPPPPIITEPIAPTSSPRATPSGQYLVSNPTASSPLNSSNIYQYQKKKRGYAEGGIPRFLSGGGDGMSDSIKAKIEGTQEARLADGEFVIPADVVSHLGNGSSKAGAKQLYDMMDRVRKARTGNPKQGREIKPTKLMPV